jgi:signal transduction histidine kinase/ligand-binding sensor domain-containing protein
MKALRYFLLLFFHSLYSFAFSQRPHVDFKHIGTNDGLSQSNVLCIFQDSRGFMWFGTPDGLNKYDSYSFTVYKKDLKKPGSLSNNYIRDIIEDKNGDLWLATWGGGLNRYDRQKDEFTHYKYNQLKTNSISGNFLGYLLQDSEGKIWISTESGIDVFDPGKNQFIHYKNNKNDENSLSDDAVAGMIEDSQHNIWIATTNGGLNLFDRKKNIFTRFQHNEKDTASISGNNIWTVFEDSKHNIWVGTVGGGLNLLNRSTGKFRVFKKNKTANSICDNVIFSIAEDNEGILWIGSENGGISTMDPKTEIFHNYQHNQIDNSSLSSSSINRIYKDKKGNIWIGTFNAGVNLMDPDMSKFIHYKHNASGSSLSNNNVLSICEDAEDNLWIGTDGGGVNLFDRKTGKFIHFEHQEGNKNTICGNYVLSVTQDSEGNIWMGTWGDGITVFNRKKNSYKHYKNDPKDPYSLIGNNAWVILKDRENNMWVGVQGKGLCRYDRDKDRFILYTHENDNLSSNNILSLFEDRNGMLWVGTDGGGLNEFNRKANKVTQFRQSDLKNSLSNNSINCIFEDEVGNLWIGTYEGLNYLDRKTNVFTTYTTKDGLPNDVISGILEDSKKKLWVSTNKGISQFDPATKKFRNFGIADGLQSDEFKLSYCKSRSGLMYFGGINGFNEFDPDSVKETEFNPRLLITNFLIANKEVPIAINEKDPSPLKKNITETRDITLPYHSAVISFEFAALNYIPSDKKRYAYMLEGFDRNWNEIGTGRRATYTNLDPGEYIFKVKSLNSEGEWSSRIISIALTITPPFWLTWWFKSGVLIVIIGGATGFYKFRINIINTQKRKLEQRVQEQTQQLLKSTNEEKRARQQAEHANIDLERKNKEMEQFAYIASHDLQEPLRTTSSFVALLHKQYHGMLDEKADKYITYIIEASDRMKVLIKNLLDFSRIGNKKELEQVDCNKTLHNVLADIGVAMSESGADIKYGPLPVINGYATEVKQLFQNLIANAIKFRKKELPPVINISVNKNRGYWEFAFKDNGIGIEEKYYEKIFLIFQRLHTRTEYEGSGIGLSHCKKIVELHKGRIWVESTPGEGSTFHFTLAAKQVNIHENDLI